MANLPDEKQSLVHQLSHVNAFALPEREANELVALCMRAARMIASARDLLSQAKDHVTDWPTITQDDDDELMKEIDAWTAEST